MGDKIIESPMPPINVPIESLPQYIWRHLQKNGKSKLLIDSVTEKGYTGHELREKAEIIALNLISLGVKPKDVLTIYTANDVEVVPVMLAALRLGVTLSLLNAMAVASDVSRELKRTGSTIMITDDLRAGNAVKGAINTPVKTILINGRHSGCLSLSTFGNRPAGVCLPDIDALNIDPLKDKAAILFSSGTTGDPKAVILTHHSICIVTELFGSPAMDFPKDFFLLFQPIAHIYGLMVLLYSISRGATVIVIKQFIPDNFVQLVAKYKSCSLTLVPPVSVLLAKSGLLTKYDLSCVTSVINGAAPLPSEVGEDIKRQLGGNILLRQGYGLTETTGGAIAVPGKAAIDKFKPLYPASVGLLLPGVQGMVVSVETGESQGPDKEGEIWLRGPNNMKEYLNNPVATAETIDNNGWLHTGDIGFYDVNGCWYVVDRLKELIKYKANQVSPSELENLLLTHPTVADAAVVGVPDAMAGELPSAWIVLKPNIKASEQDIMDFIASQVSPIKKLRGGVKFVDMIPKSPSGKILRRLMKDAVRKDHKAKL